MNIAEADSSIVVDLMYTRADNFTGKVLYEDLHEAYLHPDAMKGLLLAQQELKKRYPGRRLIVYDAARPMSVQQKMWNVVKGTSKYIYVSNPARGGGLHNYGLAVDISILDEAGNPLPMGTEVDHLGPEAHITNEAALVQSGKMTKQEQANRQLQVFAHCPASGGILTGAAGRKLNKNTRLYHKVPYIPYICADKPGKNFIPYNNETSSQTYTFHPVRCMHRLRCNGALHHILYGDHIK